MAWQIASAVSARNSSSEKRKDKIKKQKVEKVRGQNERVDGGERNVANSRIGSDINERRNVAKNLNYQK